MANGVIWLTSTSSKLEGRIVWESSNNGATANTSTVIASLQVRRNDGYQTKGTWNGFLTVADRTENFSNPSTTVGSEWVTMVRVTRNDFPHADDGTSKCWINGECNGPSGTSLSGAKVSGNDTVTLDKIPRYLNITSFEIKNITINTAQVFWSTDVPRNDTHYYLNNDTTGVGSATYGETIASDQKSGSFYVKGLSPNTQYSIKISCTRTDNGLVTTTGNKTFSTYNIATINQAPNFNIGESPTINWSNPSGCKTVTYAENIVNGKIESQLTGKIDVSGRTSYTYSLNASTLYSKVPNSNSGTIRYVIKSSNDGKDYYNSVDRNYYVTNSNPTFSNFTFKDTNSKTTALTGNNQKFIKGYSSLQATVSTANKAVAKNSATMKNYTLTVGTKNSGEVAYSSSADVNLSVNAIDNNVVFVTAKDSRQNTTAVQKTISNENYYTYTDLTITKCTLTRSDGGVGTQVTLNYEGAIWNKSFGSVTNAIVSIKYEYKIAGTSKWTTGTTKLTPTVSGSKYSQTILIQGDLAGSGFNDQNSYDFRLTVSDKLSTKQFSLTFGAGTPLVAYHKNGIAVGKKYDTNNNSILQVYGNEKVDGNLNATLEIKGQNINAYYLGVISPAKWLYLGDFDFARQGRYAIIDCFTGNGQNGNAYQNTHIKILLKQGWTGEDLPIGVTTQFTQNYNANYKVKISHTSKTKCKLYMYVPFYYNDLTYIVNGSYYSFTALNTTLESEPATDKESTYYRTDSDIIIPTVLYNNASGTTGTVTLSKSAQDYNYLEIFYVNNHGDLNRSIRISAPNGKNISIESIEPNQSDAATYLRTAFYNISGNTITYKYATYTALYNNGEVQVNRNQYSKITKVLGWY